SHKTCWASSLMKPSQNLRQVEPATSIRIECEVTSNPEVLGMLRGLPAAVHFSANVSLIHSRHRVRSSCRRSRRRGVRLPRQESDPSHAVHKWASREGRGRMASGTRGQARVAQLLHSGEAGPTAVVGSTVAIRAWLVGTSPLSPRSTTHFGAD